MTTAELFAPIPHAKGVTMSKAEIAELFGETITAVDNWVRNGCPCSRSGSVRSPLIFDSAQVHFWRCISEAHRQHGEEVARQVRLSCERDALEGELWRRDNAAQ